MAVDPQAAILFCPYFRTQRLDHTQGQEIRNHLAARYQDQPDKLEALAAPSDHVVLSSVGTASRDTIGHTITDAPRRRLLLTSDGIHQYVPVRSIARAARMFSHPGACASRLALAARHFGGRDNATAMVVDPVTLA